MRRYFFFLLVSLAVMFLASSVSAQTATPTLTPTPLPVVPPSAFSSAWFFDLSDPCVSSSLTGSEHGIDGNVVVDSSAVNDLHVYGDVVRCDNINLRIELIHAITQYYDDDYFVGSCGVSFTVTDVYDDIYNDSNETADDTWFYGFGANNATIIDAPGTYLIHDGSLSHLEIDYDFSNDVSQYTNNHSEYFFPRFVYQSRSTYRPKPRDLGLVISDYFIHCANFPEDEPLDCDSVFVPPEPVAVPTADGTFTAVPTVDGATVAPTAVPALPADVNLVQNPSFEAGMMAWTTEHGGNGALPVVSADSQDGSYVMKVFNNLGSGNDEVITLRQQFLKSLPASWYKVCALIYQEAPNERDYSVSLLLHDDSLFGVPSHGFGSENCDVSGWCQYEAVFELPVDSFVGLADGAWLDVGSGALSPDAWFYVDDVVLARTDEDGNLLPPPGDDDPFDCLNDEAGCPTEQPYQPVATCDPNVSIGEPGSCALFDSPVDSPIGLTAVATVCVGRDTVDLYSSDSIEFPDVWNSEIVTSTVDAVEVCLEPYLLGMDAPQPVEDVIARTGLVDDAMGLVGLIFIAVLGFALLGVLRDSG